MYNRRIGMPKDDAETARCYRKAADYLEVDAVIRPRQDSGPDDQGV